MNNYSTGKQSKIISIDIGELCTHCGKDTAFNSGELLRVNRISSEADAALTLSACGVIIPAVVQGYMCAECQDGDRD